MPEDAFALSARLTPEPNRETIHPVSVPSQEKVAVTSNGIKPALKSPTKTTVKLNDLLKVKTSVDQVTQVLEAGSEANELFTAEQLHLVWKDFAESRKKFQAEYHLLTQPFEIRGSHIIIRLLSMVQETMLNNFKSDLIAFLREKLRNNSILVMGELVETEEKKMLYTPRDKFEYLVEKNPALKQLRDRLGLDPDF